MKPHTIFVIALLALSIRLEETASGCLSEANLKKIGFTTVNATAEKIETPTHCTTLFKEHGACVPEAEVQTVIKTNEDKFTEANQGVVAIFDTFDSFFGNIGEKLSDLYSSIVSSDEKKEKTWKEQMSASVKVAKDKVDECFKFSNLLQHGITCLASSAYAKQVITETDTQWTISSNLNALEIVPLCMDVMSTVCMFFKGGEEAELTSPQTDEQKALCSLVVTYEGCITDGGTNTTCLTDSKKEEIFKKMYNPYKGQWLPSVADVDSIKDKVVDFFVSAKDKIFDWTGITKDASTEETTTTRILDSELVVNFTFTSEGYDCKQGGERSGVDPKSDLRISALMILAFALLTKHI